MRDPKTRCVARITSHVVPVTQYQSRITSYAPPCK
jgi:hypothetical protein